MRRLILTLTILGASLACDQAAQLSIPPDLVGAAGLELTPPAQLDFGTLPADGVARRAVRLESVGPGPLTVRAVDVTGAGQERWTVQLDTPLPLILPTGESLDLVVEHRPCPELAEPGADRCDCGGGIRSGLLRIDTDATEAPVTLAMYAEADPPGPRLVASPPAQVDLRPGVTATVTVVNTGCGPLHLEAARLSGPGGASPYGGASDIQLDGCAAWPCPLDLDVCPADAATCPTQQALRLRYDNSDPIGAELAELRLTSDDPTQPERVFVVRATEGDECRPPALGLRLETGEPCVGAPVRVALSMTPSGATAHWRWLFTPATSPELEIEGGGVSFVPAASGLFLLEAYAEGCRPEARASIAVAVLPSCR